MIHLTTFIAAPRERVFDLSLSVDLHRHSMKQYNETILDGVLSGLMKEGDTVTWKAKHFFRERVMTVKLTKLSRPEYFIDEMVKGDLASMKHEHYFKAAENGTIMIDQFHFETKGMGAGIIKSLFLNRYFYKLLLHRNEIIKQAAEGNLWKQFLEK